MIVKVIDEVKNYEEAIKLSCDELVKNGSIEDRYYDAILSKNRGVWGIFLHSRPYSNASCKTRRWSIKN